MGCFLDSFFWTSVKLIAPYRTQIHTITRDVHNVHQLFIIQMQQPGTVSDGARHVDLGQHLKILGMMLPEIFRHSQAIANLGCHGATSLTASSQVCRDSASGLPRESSKRIVKAKSVNDGKQVDMEFSDGTAFRFHTGWMKDSHPNLVGEDTYRKSAQTILENDQYTAEMLNLSSDGSLISVHFKNHSNQKGVTEEYPSDWLHAFAPYVGSPLNNSSYMTKGSGLPDTGSLLEDIYKNRKPWDSTLEIPKFSGPELLKDENLQIQFLETMMETGIAMISNIGKPQSFQDVDCGKPLEDFVFSIIGRINQHPVRATRFGVIHSEAAVAENSSDYDCKNPLSMHWNGFVAGWGRQGWYQISQFAGDAWSQWPRKILQVLAPVHQALTWFWRCDGKLPLDPLAQANSFSFDGIGHLEGPHGDLSTVWRKITRTR